MDSIIGGDIVGSCLLSIDWDYFICTQKENWGSYLENNKNLINSWYKRYIESWIEGKDIQKSYQLSSEAGTFWEKIKKHFQFEKDIKACISDSHALSYSIAEKNGCNCVYLFDAHSDLGYGGLSSLDFELNCANWLGKLLKDKQIEEAHIIYSPYTTEEPKCFELMNNVFNISYQNINDLGTSNEVSAIHICRSGAWTPSWMDENFNQFVDASGISYEITDCPQRKWEIGNISLSEQIYYMMM